MKLFGRDLFFGDNIRYGWCKEIFRFFWCRIFHQHHHIKMMNFAGWGCRECGECGHYGGR